VSRQTLPPEQEVAYASAFRLLDEALEAFLPPERVSVAEHAARHRWLADGPYAGLWQHSKVPYLVEPMESLERPWRSSVIVGPGQSGKTSVAENWLLKSVDVDQAPFLWFMQTDDGIEAYVKGRINPMIEGHLELRRKLGEKPVDNSLHFKLFRGMTIEFLSATYSNLINKKAARIVADEVDAYDPTFGDVKALLDLRMQTYGEDAHSLFLSHPDLATGLDPETDWHSGIMAIYADSDRRVWHWPCPECGGIRRRRRPRRATWRSSIPRPGPSRMSRPRLDCFARSAGR
jgi:phage terminase large subunit GpA-like protein